MMENFQIGDKQVTHRPKGRMCMNCIHAKEGCGLRFEEMKPIGKDADGTIVVACTNYIKKGF